MTEDTSLNEEIEEAPPDKIVVYTAIFGGYDGLQPALTPSICLTDGTVEAAKGWEIRVVESAGLDSRRAARRCKILAHEYFPDADYTLWHDGNYRLRIPPEKAVKEWLGKRALAAFKHPHRRCIYREAEVCMRRRKDDPKRIQQQIARYDEQGFPQNYGLIASGVLVRCNTNIVVRKLCEIWWQEVLEYSYRDQLSFDYARWRTGLKINYIPGMIHRNEYFRYGAHGRRYVAPRRFL